MWQEMQRERRESQLAIFTALFAAKWAEIKALWWLRCSAPLVSPSPLRPGGWIFQKATATPAFFHKLSGECSGGTETTPHPTPNPPSRSKRITNWISMWYIHYRKILCCSPLKAHHPPLPSTFPRTHISPTTPTTTQTPPPQPPT